jgi:NADH dehydrogenase [ubiquinone] 1 alpha subcomplex assembly factor 1
MFRSLHPLKLLLPTLLACNVAAHAAEPMPDFSRPAAARGFRVINDGVMGGVSSSQLAQSAGSLVFEGIVSLENNGGFASFRGPVTIPPGTRSLRVTLRGDGQRYKLTLKAEDNNAGPQYQAGFVAPPDWVTVSFSAADFAASFRGRTVEAPALAMHEMRAIGVLIADRQAGPFRLEIRSIAAE